MKKIAILCLSLLTLATMSFTKKVNVKEFSTIGAPIDMWVYMGHNPSCDPGRGFCDWQMRETGEPSLKAVPATVTNNGDGTITMKLIEADLDDANKEFYKNVKVFEILNNFTISKSEICQKLELPKGTKVIAGSYPIKRENESMIVTFKISK